MRINRRAGKFALRLLFVVPLWISSFFFESLSALAFVGLYFIFELSIRIVEDLIYGSEIDGAELTGLQIANSQLVKQTLFSNGISKIEESEYGARDKYILLKARGDISIYLYRDGEANMVISEDGKIKDDYRYELPDFRDESELIQRLLSQLKSHLSKK